MDEVNEKRVVVVGLGYVGLPLAVAFGRRFPTLGYDVNEQRVAACQRGYDDTGEVDADAFTAARSLRFTHRLVDCADAEVFIVAVPTPVDEARRPDLGALTGACEAVGSVIRKGATVVFESTVYPGVTEELCVPVLEEASGLQWRRDFHVGYSPERVNPGDREHALEAVTKLVAADDDATRELLSELYGAVIQAGVYEVDSIATAEAAKVIENTQRDLNIALVNELAIIFDRLGLDTVKVLEAAGTKWNFLPFRPGLVGGHCIGVDPYYLTYKAQMAGYHPEVILAGRRINDGMGRFVADRAVKTMLRSGIELSRATVTVLGITFKENCPDLRNSQVASIIEELQSYGCFRIVLHDPVANPAEVRREYGHDMVSWDDLPRADAIILAVAHRQFAALSADQLRSKLADPAVLVDVKAMVDSDDYTDHGISVWRL